MAYDEGLAQRIREALDDQQGLEEKKMFGGVGFMVRGNMAVGVNKEDLIVRVGPEGHEAALEKPGVRVFDITGKPMKGWVTVAPEGVAEDADLAAWVEEGVAFALSLPPK